MSDIVERLRSFNWRTMTEAADEIERLRRLCQDLGRTHQENEEKYGQAADEIDQLRLLVRSIAAIDEDFIKTTATVRGLRLHLLNLRTDARQILGEP